MTDLFDYGQAYPSAPGWKRRATSKRAADDMKPKAAVLREKCLAVLRDFPDGLTADGVAHALKADVLSIRPRISELANRNLIEDTGRRGRNRSGKPAVIWKVRA